MSGVVLSHRWLPEQMKVLNGLFQIVVTHSIICVRKNSFHKVHKRRKENCRYTEIKFHDKTHIRTLISRTILTIFYYNIQSYSRAARRFGLCAGPNDNVSGQSEQKHCYCSCTGRKAGAESKARGQMAPPAPGDWRSSILASLHCSRVLPCNTVVFVCII